MAGRPSCADADHAAQPDPAAGLQAGDVRAAVEHGGQLAGRVGDLARQHGAVVLDRADLRRVQPALDHGPARLAQRPDRVGAGRRVRLPVSRRPGPPGVDRLDLVPDVERDDGGHRAPDAADPAGDPVRGVVVQQPSGQRRVAAPRQDHGDVGAGRGRLGRGQLGRGVAEPPVRAVRQLQRDGEAGRQPALPELVRLRAVQAEVHRAQRGRVQALGVPDRGDGGQVVAVD